MSLSSHTNVPAHTDPDRTSHRSDIRLEQETARNVGESAVGDRKLQERVQRAINDTSYHFLRDAVQVRVAKGQVELQGHVPSYYMKQVAQTAAMNVAGVATLNNELRVGTANSGTSPTGSVQRPR